MITLEDIICRRCINTPSIHIQYVISSVGFLYSHPERAYHNDSHINDCLKKIEMIGDFIDPCMKDIISLALIYHDCIYDSKRKDNEELSAQKAFMDLTFLGFQEKYAEMVYDLILLTNHKKKSYDINDQIIMDIDMSILGEPEDVFLEYEKNIRKEYSFIRAEEYVAGRTQFLNGLLSKDSIFQTDFFNDRYGKQAFANINKLISALPDMYKEEPVKVIEDRYYKKNGIQIHCYKCVFGADCLYREFSAACHHSFQPFPGKFQE